MDDDDGGPRWSLVQSVSFAPVPESKGAASKRKQGVYRAASQGVLWIWSRNSEKLYHKLTVRDASADQDLCVASFPGVKGAAKLRGRRNNTVLPEEDLVVLKQECISDSLCMSIVGGPIIEADNSCFPATCYFRDIEEILACSCRWDVGKNHILEIEDEHENTQNKRNTTGCGTVVEPANRAKAGCEESKIDVAIKHISIALMQTSQQAALDELNHLHSWLKVPW